VEAHGHNCCGGPGRKTYSNECGRHLYVVIIDRGSTLQRSRYIRSKNVVTSYKVEK